MSKQRASWYLGVVARLKPGVTPEQSAAEIQTIGRTLEKQYPDANGNVGMTTFPLQEAMVTNIRQAVLVLLGAVGFVLLIACANVANLLLARAAARESEMAVRTALGAGRSRLLRQLLTESVILSLCGAGVGLLFAIWGVAFLTSLQPDGIPRLEAVQVDGTVIAFTLGVAVLTGLIFGLIPALHATRGVSHSLKESGRGAVTSRAGARVRGTLVVIEMALAVMLLAGAGLLLRSFVRLQAVDPGFRPDRTLSFELTLPDSRYQADAKRVAFFDQLLSGLRALPGVSSVGTVMGLPLTGMDFNISFEIGGRPPLSPADQPAMEVRVASPDYFGTIGIPLKRGRLFSADDRAGSPQVAVISESAARQYFPNEDPIGKTIKLGWGKGGPARAGGADRGHHRRREERCARRGQLARGVPAVEPVAGVADDGRPSHLGSADGIDGHGPLRRLRGRSEPAAVEHPDARSDRGEVDFAAALLHDAAGHLRGGRAGAGGDRDLRRALVRRWRSAPVKSASAWPSVPGRAASSGLVVRQAMTLVLAGVVVGTVAALPVADDDKDAVQREADRPGDLRAVAIVLVGVALLACYVPARRATRVDPMAALRAE